MSMKKCKNRPASAAKKSVCKSCTKTKPCQPTLEELLANEVSQQPHVLVLKSNKDDKRKKPSAKREYSEAQVQCCCDSLDELSSCESQDDDDNCDNGSDTVTDNAEEKPNSDESSTANTAKSTNSCWMGCFNPCRCRYGPCNGPCGGPCSVPCNGPCNGPCSGPCNGRFYYCGNCYNGCRKCYCYPCNPCAGYCCSQPPADPPKIDKAHAKSKEKVEGGKGTHKRKKGGVSESNPNYSILPPPPILGFPFTSPSTMSGYSPTVPPQYISPYSGRWRASEVVNNPMFSNKNP
ncbi:hypothetical protein KR200_002938 [Drosophila serrata]|nr:hypothetical protein KR200_002938 [Drosophila serrata]